MRGKTQPPAKRQRSELDRQAARYQRKIRREAIRTLLERRALVARSSVARNVYGSRIKIPCGAHARTSGEPCKRPGIAPTYRCRLHGGTRQPLPPCLRDFLHDFHARHGRRGAEMRWARVRAAGGLSCELRAFLSECGREGGRGKAKG